MQREGLNILEALENINPAFLSYQEWCNVGMALKLEGYSCSVWDSWSSRDFKRYHIGECEKKWEGFHGNDTPVTAGTIFQYAFSQGWSPVSEGHEIDWNDSIGENNKDELKVVNAAWMEVQDLPDPPDPFDCAREMIRYFRLLFESSENVGYVTQSYLNEDGKHVPTKGCYDRTAGQLIQLLSACNGDIGSVLGDYDADAGAWIRFNPLDGKGVKNENVTDFRFALVESDTLDLQKQYSLIRELQLPVAVLVHSGGKSLHAIVRIEAANYVEYRQRVDFLYNVCQKNGMDLDRQNRNPSRLSRLPGVYRKGKPQYIIAENIGFESFVAWKEYIESVNDNLPDSENLHDALLNLPPLAPELIFGVLRKGHKMLLSGPSKAGKSFALIELCVAIAEGGDWLGLHCAEGSVLYVNLELDRASCLHRFADVYESIGIDKSSRHPERIEIWNLRGSSTPMDKLAPKLIRRASKKNFTAVIIDPIYKVITGDENSADQMSLFCNQFDKICNELNCAVIYCHHHSKGQQGQKRSMDRASGSGVFARDPDALLDMIELDIPSSSRDELVNRSVRDVCLRWLKMCRSDWETILSPDDMCSHVSLRAACASYLSSQTMEFVIKEIEAVTDKIRRKTGWRIEGILREFSPMSPVFAWFEYPVHKKDEDNILSTLFADGEKKIKNTDRATSARIKNAAQRKLSKKEELRNALLLANGGDPVNVHALAVYMDAKDNTVRKWLRENGFGIDRNSGNVIEIENVDMEVSYDSD